MKKVFCGVSFFLLIGAMFFLTFNGLEASQSRKTLIEEKYAGWSGVLRIRVSDELSGLVGWLNECGARFEKRHNGVYVQAQVVDAAALALHDDGVRPPELLLFTPGDEIDRTQLAVPGELPLREAFQHESPAVPVGVSGYLWAVNRAMLDEISSDLTGVEISLLLDSEGKCFSRALAALSSGISEQPGEIVLPDVDLGLEIAPTPTEFLPTELVPIRLPEITPSESAFTRFLNGETAATVVSSDELKRLKSLRDQGRGPDWTTQWTGARAFTDRLILCGAVKSGDEREALALELIALLLEEESQTALGSRGWLSVTDAPSGLKSTDPLSALDQALRTQPVELPEF